VPFLSTDIALKSLEMDPNIAIAENACGWRALEELARKPLQFAANVSYHSGKVA
jgi:hypothetical protein